MSEQENKPLGISGRIAKQFLQSEITLLLALLGLFLGLFAIMVTPREEEPQINVTFANVFIAYPGASAREVESLVSVPAEQVLSEIEGIRHVYSVSRPGMSVLTVEYKVGEDRTQAIVRLYNKIFSNSDWLPQGLGIAQPIIKPKGIDDVPIVSLTLWTEDQQRSSYDLLQVAHALEAELKRVPGTREIFTIGGAEQVVKVLLDPQLLAAYGLSLNDLQLALNSSNASSEAGVVVHDNLEIQLTAGRFLSSASDVAQLVVGLHKGQPVYLSDIAEISFSPAYASQYVFYGQGMAKNSRAEQAQHYPAVTLAVNKQPGTNAVDIASAVIERMDQLQGIYLPDGVKVSVTRNYGETADSKAKTLITKLIFATSIVVLLVLVALGRREAFIVGSAVVITLAITLFASWAWGFTLNRVSLFALIFSIGILVDDAIVVVENIHRHMSMGNDKLLEAIPKAVDEVGGPTILATFTVIAALLPMAFVSGLMGPYMSPIPINASMGMLISLAVAFVITPWMCYKFLSKSAGSGHEGSSAGYSRFFTRLIGPFLDESSGRKRRGQLALAVLVLIALSLALVYTQHVVLKMLPFDNKSEFQIVVDMPEGSPLEHTTQVMEELGAYVASVPEVINYQIYSGTAAPINFNGLVRQYYLRSGSNVGDIQVNLLDKSLRDKESHDIAREMREPLQKIGAKFNANVKLAEVPPGPPVMSPLVAEVYGLDYAGQIGVAKDIRKVFESTDDIVDVDDTIITPAPRYIVHVDRQKAAMLGVSQQEVTHLLQTLLQGYDAAYLHGENFKYAVPIRLELPLENKSDLEQIMSIKLQGRLGVAIPLEDIVHIEKSVREQHIYHKDLQPVVFVTGDMAGELDSPLYGMVDMIDQLKQQSADQNAAVQPLNNGQGIHQYFINQPANPYEYSMKWDGEWQITYETFRDMGIAYSVGLLLIYFLVVAQFRSYIVPLIIMAPIPLTIIGVMPGHALLGAKFTATSMIGMIALAGIIVRNSILLVDFINEQLAEGMAFRDAVIEASAVRSKPIVLTALAAMMGALFILDDPIFSGLAISLIFGILVSTLLTLLVIPVMYYAVMKNKLDKT
ncbi:MAG TPA: efflux RND transporter permease subunit [Gammaproteobacteria bacterium]